MEFHHVQFPASFTAYPDTRSHSVLVSRHTKQTSHHHAMSGQASSNYAPVPQVTNDMYNSTPNPQTTNSNVALHAQARITSASLPLSETPVNTPRVHNPYAGFVLDTEALEEVDQREEVLCRSRSRSMASSGFNTPSPATSRRGSLDLGEQLASGVITPLPSPNSSFSDPYGAPLMVYRRDPYSWRPCPITIPMHSSPRQSPSNSSFASSSAAVTPRSSRASVTSTAVSARSQQQRQQSYCSSLNTTGSDASELELDGSEGPSLRRRVIKTPEGSYAIQPPRALQPSTPEPERSAGALTPAAQLITPKQLCVVVRKLLTRLTTSSTLEAEDVSTAATTTIPAPRSVEVWKRVVMEGIKFEGAVVKTPSKDASTTTANAEFSVLINFRSKNKELAKLLDDLGLLPPEVAAAVRAVNFAKNPSLRVIPPLGDLGLKTFLEAQVFQATGLPAQVILHEHRPTIRSRQSK